MKKGSRISNSKGFTLIELMLYVSILAIILLTTSGFLYTILQVKTRNQAITEVDQQGIQVMQLITQAVRNGTLVNSPTTGVSAASLSINTPTSANNPIVFDLSSGVFRIKEGSAAAISLTNSRIIVSGLSFINLASSIKIQFTISLANTALSEYSYSQTYYGTANLRP